MSKGKTKAERKRMTNEEPLKLLPFEIAQVVTTGVFKGRRHLRAEWREVVGEELTRVQLPGGGSMMLRSPRYGRTLARSSQHPGGILDREARAAAQAELGRKPILRPRLSPEERQDLNDGHQRRRSR